MQKHTNRGSLGCGIYLGKGRSGARWNLFVHMALTPEALALSLHGIPVFPDMASGSSIIVFGPFAQAADGVAKPAFSPCTVSHNLNLSSPLPATRVQSNHSKAGPRPPSRPCSVPPDPPRSALHARRLQSKSLHCLAGVDHRRRSSEEELHAQEQHHHASTGADS